MPTLKIHPLEEKLLWMSAHLNVRANIPMDQKNASVRFNSGLVHTTVDTLAGIAWAQCFAQHLFWHSTPACGGRSIAPSPPSLG